MPSERKQQFIDDTRLIQQYNNEMPQNNKLVG